MLKISKKGFSLIELIVVIIIIGILLSAMMKFTSTINYAKINSTISQLNKIHKAVDNYMTNNKGIASYSLLNNISGWNTNSGNGIWNLYFGGHKVKNGFGKEWSVSVNSSGNLVISSNVRSLKSCQEIKKHIQDQVSNVTCTGDVLKVSYSDGN